MAGEDIVLKVGFDGKQAEKGLDKLKNQSKSFSNELTARFAGLFTASALLDRGLNYVAASFQKIATLGAQSRKAGLSVEDFQRVSNVAALADVSVSGVAKALRELRKQTAEAANGNEKSKKALEGLGFSAEEINSGNIEATEILARLARAYSMARTEAERYTIATSILSDRTGTELIPLLGEGEQSIRGAMKKKVVTQAQAQAADDISDNLDTIGQDLTGAFGSFMGQLMEISGSVMMAINRNPHITGLIEEGKIDEAVQYFEGDEYQRSLRFMAAGGNLGSYEDLKRQMFAEYFPQLHSQRVREEMNLRTQAANATPAAATSPAFGAATGDALQAIGGGGYYVAGAATMTDYASRTADASERTAAAVERMADGGVGEPPVGE